MPKVHSARKWKFGFETRQCDFRTPDVNHYTSLSEQIYKWFSSAQKLLNYEKQLNWAPFSLALLEFFIVWTFQTGDTTH